MIPTAAFSALPPQLRVRVLVLDVDGVLTDGGLGFGVEGESKFFSARDGQAIRWFRRAGGKVAFLSGRRSLVLERRAAELEIEILAQDVISKLPEFKRIAGELGAPFDEICYVGDDLVDLPCMKVAGLAVAVADAAEEVRRAAHCVTRSRGGQGAVRELVEWLMKSQGRWEELMERYR